MTAAADIGNPFDFNRDGRVNALDLAAVRTNVNRLLPTPTLAPAGPSPSALPSL